MADAITAMCPGCCARDADPLTESVEWCYHHIPYARGLDDARVAFPVEAAPEAEQQRALCRAVHGRRHG